jgi:hypothetical protein
VDAKVLEKEIQDAVSQLEKDRVDLEKKQIWLDKELHQVEATIKDILRQVRQQA